MPPLVSKCQRWIVALLLIGAVIPLCLIPVISSEGWSPKLPKILICLAVVMALYALLLLPTRVTISSDGISQHLPRSQWHVKGEDIAEWRYDQSGAQTEQGDLRNRTKGRWHGNRFWIRDKAGKKYYLKSWLVFGHRSKQVADILRDRKIQGG